LIKIEIAVSGYFSASTVSYFGSSTSFSGNNVTGIIFSTNRAIGLINHKSKKELHTLNVV
jgi:hypothetical protein